MFDTFVAAVRLDAEKARRFALTVTYLVASTGCETGCTASLGYGVRGGYLGRDHTLNDIRNHFLRDSLVWYIWDKLSVSDWVKWQVRQAICPKLELAMVICYDFILNEVLKQQVEEENEKLKRRVSTSGRKPPSQVPGRPHHLRAGTASSGSCYRVCGPHLDLLP